MQNVTEKLLLKIQNMSLLFGKTRWHTNCFLIFCVLQCLATDTSEDNLRKRRLTKVIEDCLEKSSRRRKM